MNRSKFRTLAGFAAIGIGGALLARAAIRRARYFDLTGRGVIVTGGSRGLGLALARELASRGAKLALCARDARELHVAQEELASRGAEVFVDTCDVAKPADVARFVARAQGYFRGGGGAGVEVLVNNAGTILVGPISHMNLDDFRDTMSTNFDGALQFILEVLPGMRARHSGRIVNIASFGGKVPAPHLAAYAASKFALVGLSQSLRAELLDDGVLVTTVCPGLMRTGSARQVFFKGQYQKELKFFATAAHLPVVSISPERIARRIVDALQFGEAEVSLPFVERWISKLHALLPGLSTDAAALVNMLLPSRASTGGDLAQTGKAVDQGQLDRFTRARLEQAERRYNQVE